MCDPVSMGATQTAISSVGSIMGFIGQGQAAKANSEAANQAYGQTQTEVQQRGVEVDQQQSENTMQALINAASLRGKISASAAAMGTDAATTAGVAHAADFATGRGLAIEDLNSQNQRTDLGDQLTSAELQRQSQINRVIAPSPLSLGLGLADAGMQGATLFSKLGGTLPGLSKDATQASQLPTNMTDVSGDWL